ncbi:MAG: type II toxin-antitoxin system Phd/YefM family antitoxin [Treponema sp.]|nr:type II toxin-antitoxin system Phd/YefM family antitoxin [Treponema sp.]
MTVPLFDVKSKLSEYVNFVQDGEAVCITKHGKVCAVIISNEIYEKEIQHKAPPALERYLQWKSSCQETDDDSDFDPWAIDIIRKNTSSTNDARFKREFLDVIGEDGENA